MLRAVKVGQRPWVVCPANLTDMVRAQMAEIGIAANLIVEPVGRNTTAAILAGALVATRYRDDPTLLFMPCDHVIGDDNEWLRAVSAAAKSGSLIKLLGVQPTWESQAYGYIVPKPFNGYVADFVEKPNDPKPLIEAGALWNAGMFLGKAVHFLKAGVKACPAVYNRVIEAVDNSRTDQMLDPVTVFLGDDYANAPAVQFDRAVIEKVFDFCSVTRLNTTWSDVGTWPSLIDAAAGRAGGDYTITASPTGDVVTTGPVVEVLCDTHLTVVATTERVLVSDDANLHRLPEVAARNPSNEEARPWGSFCTLATDPHGRWKIKRLRVDPGGAISLQKHAHRSETWMVVSGEARVTVGQEILCLGEKQTVHIPVGVRHRVENTQRKVLELLEIQTGNYFGEDDIVRLHDVYGRV